MVDIIWTKNLELTIEKVVRQKHLVENCFQRRSQSKHIFQHSKQFIVYRTVYGIPSSVTIKSKWSVTYRLGTSLSKIESAITASSKS